MIPGSTPIGSALSSSSITIVPLAAIDVKSKKMVKNKINIYKAITPTDNDVHENDDNDEADE